MTITMHVEGYYEHAGDVQYNHEHSNGTEDPHSVLKIHPPPASITVSGPRA